MVFLFLCVYLHLYDITFSTMDHVRKQRGSIVLYKEKRNGADYIRIEYADSEAVGILLSQDAEKTGENSACIPAAAFRCLISTTAIRPTPTSITAGFM